MTDAIVLETELACIVGILPRERVEPQPLQIRVEMGLDLDPCGVTGDLDKSVDYAVVDTQIRFLCTEGRFRLIEVLGVTILRLLLAAPAEGESRAALSWASVEIRKPAVLRAAVPAVRLRREAAWAASAHMLADVEEVRARRVVVAPGDRIEGAGMALIGGSSLALPVVADEAGVAVVVQRLS